MSNLTINHSNFRKSQEATLQKTTYCHLKLLNQTSCVQESLPHAYISSYSSTALQKWPYASNTSHHHTDFYQYTVETTWRTSKAKTHLHKVKEKTHSDRAHCHSKTNSSVQVSSPAQGWLTLHVLLQVPLSASQDPFFYPAYREQTLPNLAQLVHGQSFTTAKHYFCDPHDPKKTIHKQDPKVTWP